MEYIFKGDVKIVNIYMVKFNALILNRLKVVGFFVNTEYIHKHNVVFNKIVTKPVTTLTKCFFPYLNPTGYLNKKLYGQVDGVSMGSTLGPLIANLIITGAERVVVKGLFNYGYLKFYIKLMDDMLVLMKKPDVPMVLWFS